MKTFNFFGVLLISFILFSCGGGEQKQTSNEGSNTKLEVNSQMEGALSSNFEVVDASLNIASQSFGHKLLVEVKRTGTDFSFDVNDAQVCGKSAGKGHIYCISADIMDGSGTPLVTNLKKYGYDAFEKALSLNNGETIWLEFAIYNQDLIKNPSKAKSVKVKSSLEKNNIPNTPSSSSEASSNEASANEWDKVLDDYEDYVDKYVKFYKKAMAGDNSAMNEYPAMMEKANSFAKKLESASGDLTTKQMTRMTKIQQKMLEAVQ